MANPNQISLYLPPGVRAQIAELQTRLRGRGIEFSDNRKNASISGLIRWLVEQQLTRERNRAIADPDAPYPEDDPWDEMGLHE